MAPASSELSAPGAVSYDSETMTVGDGTWDFNKNTFLLPNLQGLNFETMRYNGMGNRFSTLTQYHSLVRAHAIMGAMIFLFLIPFSVMTARFYSHRPGFAVKYHAQVNIFAGMLLLAVFILGYFAVGPERSLTNPHHGIGVAIFAMFILQIVGGRLVRHITKSRSLRIMLHQWCGRAIALLGITQVPLGLTLYGSPKYLFILYAVWMGFLLVIYFILSYRSESRREFYMSGAQSARTETTRTRVTESEYFASGHETEEPSSKTKWLGPLAAGAGLFALTRGRNKNRDRSRSPSRSPSRSSLDRSRGPEVVASRRGSASYLTDKYSEPPTPKKKGGGFMKTFGTIAAAIGAGKLVSGMMNKRERDRDEEYSAVSTETPRRYRSNRGAPTMTDFTSDVTQTTRREADMTQTSLSPPTRNPATTTLLTRTDLDSRLSSQPPTTPRRATRPHRFSRASYDESDYVSYQSPSRREPEERPSGGGGVAKGFLDGLGFGWFAKKLADRKANKEEQRRLRDEEDMRSGTSVSRFTGDGHLSPTRQSSVRRPVAQRRPTGFNNQSTVLSSELTESSIETPRRGPYGHHTDLSTLPPSTLPPSTLPPSTLPPSTLPLSTLQPSTISPSTLPPVASGHGSRSRQSVEHVSMPLMPPDPQGILAPGGSEASGISPGSRPQRSRQGRAPVMGGLLATESDLPLPEDRVRYASPASLSVKLKVHDDRDRNVTLRRLTEEEAMKARGRRGDTESNISEMESPSYGRRRYRRDSSQRRAEAVAERRVEAEDPIPLSPPNPSFAKAKRVKDSAYYSGQQTQGGPSSAVPPPVTPLPDQTVSSLGSMGESHGNGTWSALTPSPPGREKPTPAGSIAAADNRRRRRQERRRASESSKQGDSDMYN
ncbi:hypothetical protein QQX98_011435 [Neonectria punicea]|uniref:Cytochrome b561 domain-containing protein n=1 Tax=Neonectria punicea TaxID=979145 RepID=A0ABR1GLP7_9HYPO